MAIDSDHCLCSMHVHSAARLVSIKSMMLAVFKFCFLLFQLLYLDNKEKNEHGLFIKSYDQLIKHYEHDFVTTVELVICVVLAFVAMLLYYGNRQHKPVFYYPFIIYSALEAIQAVLNIGYFIYATYEVGYGQLDLTLEHDSDRKRMFIYCIIITAVFALLYTIRTYVFLIVIIQALRYLQRALKQTNASRITVPNNMSNTLDNNKTQMLSDFSGQA